MITVFNDQDGEIVNNKLTKLDFIAVTKDFTTDNELSTQKSIDDSVGEGTNLKFNLTLENFPKVSVGESV